MTRLGESEMCQERSKAGNIALCLNTSVNRISTLFEE